MEDFGAYLEREREAREISLAEVARITRISPRFLDALESGRYDELPELTFVRGFLRAYAEAVGLDPSTVVLRYESEVLGGGTRSRAAGDWRRRAVTGGAFGLVAVVLVLGAWWGSRSGSTPATPQPSRPAVTPSPDPTPRPAPPDPPPQVEAPLSPAGDAGAETTAEAEATETGAAIDGGGSAPAREAPVADPSNPLADLVGLEPAPDPSADPGPTLTPVAP